MYALAKAETSDDVHEGLSQIVPHIFGEHKLCSDVWCSFKRDSYGQPLKEEGLRHALFNIFQMLWALTVIDAQSISSS